MTINILGYSYQLDESQTKILYENDWYEITEDMEGEPYIIVGDRTVYLEPPEISVK